MKTKKMLLTIPDELNELLLDRVARDRKSGIKSSKEAIIIHLLLRHKKEII